MRKFGFAVLGALALTGCASTVLQSYVGKTIADAMLDYGPPANAFDMGDGRRAFTWIRRSGFVIPGSSFTTGDVRGGFFSATTIGSPAMMGTSECAYSVFAVRDGTADTPTSWKIVGYQPPKPC